MSKHSPTTSNWQLYYKKRGKVISFAEIRTRSGQTTLTTGKAFTHGETRSVRSLSAAQKMLTTKGYRLEREWVHNRRARDYETFVREIISAIEMDPTFAKSNALALMTDSDLMTIGYVLHRFKNVSRVPGDKLWIVDEWSDWGTEVWQMDIAYRWMLGYGYLDPKSDAKHHRAVINCLKKVLRAFSEKMDLVLIYVGGDDCGHRWSASCMKKPLAAKMLKWLG